MYLSEEWLAYERKLGFRPVITGTAEEIRTGYNGLAKTIGEQLPPSDPSLTLVSAEGHQVPVRIYTPREASDRKLPVGVYAHGGGFVAGSVTASFEDYNCRYIAQNTPCIIVSVDFRLAPEHLVPAQVDDVYAAFLWTRDNIGSLNGDPAKLFVIGASVGGGLALSVALKHIERGGRGNVAGIVALAPITMHPEHVMDEFRPDYTAYEENAEGPLINRAAMYVFNGLNGCDARRDDPDVFPALHPLLRTATGPDNLPRTFISTCGADPLRDDGTVIKRALDRLGVPCRLRNYEGLPHFFWIYPEIATGDTFRADTVEGVRFVLQ
ncbi:Alpha/Beta hydrolase protein [Corynascus novoguineensis]|uniref:Alpha/Beta hydrolase protein n=1 Tax=Corynascus novoguineensis TaxID=1126955 RepID=A0AAN7CLK2_9PEZI|nr:Alpha/Beta hydrolase protein [Corynascus novoguineensis]